MREPLRAIVGDEHVILQAQSEFVRNEECRLIRKHHARMHLERISPDKVRPFMDIHAQAVTNAVNENFVVRAISGIVNNLASGGVNSLTLHTGFRGCSSGGLRTTDNIKTPKHDVSGLSVNPRSRYIRLVSLDETPVVDEDHRILSNDLRRYGAMRQCAVWPCLAIRLANNAHMRVGASTEL